MASVNQLIASTVLQFGKAVELSLQKNFHVGARRKRQFALPPEIVRQKREGEEPGRRRMTGG
jgi:hypothetical protein